MHKIQLQVLRRRPNCWDRVRRCGRFFWSAAATKTSQSSAPESAPLTPAAQRNRVLRRNTTGAQIGKFKHAQFGLSKGLCERTESENSLVVDSTLLIHCDFIQKKIQLRQEFVSKFVRESAFVSWNEHEPFPLYSKI